MGETLTYTFNVENTGNVTLTSLSITDPDLDVAATCTATTLAPGDTTSCQGSSDTILADLNAGSITNTATASANDPGGNAVNSLQAQATAMATQAPALSLVKSASPDTYSKVGDTITYTYKLTNDGNVTLSTISTTDSELGSVCDVTTLAPTGMETCTAQLTITQAHIDARSVTNTAQASGQDPQGQTVSSNEVSTTVNALLGSITIVKTLQGGTLQSSQSFDFDGGSLGSFSLPEGGNFDKSFVDLQSVQYTVVETSQPNKAWSVSSITCDAQKFTVVDNTVIIDLGPGENVMCTFTNVFDQVDEKMELVTKLFLHRRVDNLLTHGPDRARLIRRLGPQTIGGSGNSGGTPPLKVTGQYDNQTTDIGRQTVGLNEGGAADTPLSNIGGNYNSHAADNDQQTVGTKYGGATGTLPIGLTGQYNNQTTDLKFSTSLFEIMQDAVSRKQAELSKIDKKLALQSQALDNAILTTRPGLNIWAEGHVTRYDDSTAGINREGDFKILYLGADYALSENIVIGGLVQVDRTYEELVDMVDLSGEVEGDGWLIGPYVGIRLTPGLLFDARFAWGQSDNRIALDDDALGFRTGEFDTERWLATARLTGNWSYGGLLVTPSAELAYGMEDQDAYKNSLGQDVRANEISIGRLTFGPEISYTATTEDGSTIRPHVSIEGIWNFDTKEFVADGSVKETEDFRAKIEGGIIFQQKNGYSIRAAGHYDGIGDDDLESYGGEVTVNVPLN